MTVSTTPARVQYAGNGVTTAFVVPWRFLANGDVLVYLVDDDGNPVAQVLTSDYTLTGAGDDAGGTLTMLAAPASTDTLAILRDPEVSQEVDYASNDTFPAETHERALDKLTMIAQRLADRIGRSLRFSDGDPTANADLELGPVQSRLGKFLYFNATTGAPEMATGAVAGVALTRSTVGEVLYPQTAEEAAAGVTPSAYYRDPHEIRRYGTDAAGLLQLLKVCEKGATGVIPRGVTVSAPAWTQYVTTQPVVLTGGGTITGDGASNFLKPGAAFTFDGVKFDTWLSVAKNVAADSGTITRLEVRGCAFTNCAANAIDIERPITSGLITGNTFDGCVNYNIRIGKDSYALQDTWTKVAITENVFTAITSASTNNAAAAIVYGKEVTISDNIVNGVDATAGTGEAHGFYTKTRQATITGNKITNVTNVAGSATCTGIDVKGNSRGATAAPQGYNTLVEGNVIRGPCGYGVRVQVDECIVNGNIIEEPVTAAILIDAATGNNVVVSGNKGFVTTAGSTSGIICTANGSRYKISDNIMDGFDAPIMLSVGATDTLDSVLVEGNVLKGATYGIRLSVAAGGTLSYATLRDNLVKSATDGVQMPSAGTTTGLVVENNDLRGATTKINGSIPSGTIVRNNRGYITENGGTTAAIATGATVSHGCAVTPAQVYITALESGPTDIYVGAIGSSTFTINFGGGGSHVFAWQAFTTPYYAN